MKRAAAILALVSVVAGCLEQPKRPRPLPQHVARWSELKIGMTETEVITVLGKPDDIIPAQANRRYHTARILVWGWTVPIDDSAARFVGLDNAYHVVFRDDGTVAKWHRPEEKKKVGESQQGKLF